MSNENKNSSNEVVIYRPYKTINGKRIYPKKSKVFRFVLRAKTA